MEELGEQEGDFEGEGSNVHVSDSSFALVRRTMIHLTHIRICPSIVRVDLFYSMLRILILLVYAV